MYVLDLLPWTVRNSYMRLDVETAPFMTENLPRKDMNNSRNRGDHDTTKHSTQHSVYFAAKTRASKAKFRSYVTYGTRENTPLDLQLKLGLVSVSI